MLAAFMSGAAAPRSQPTEPTPSSVPPQPPVPFERTASEAPVVASSNTAAAEAPSSSSSNSQKRPSFSSNTSFTRIKRRATWKGKTCVIALPWDHVRDENGEPKQLLTAEAVRIRLAAWREQGYHVDGFDLHKDMSETDPERPSQSCAILPDPSEILKERLDAQPRVQVPNKAAWDTYVQRLQEARLEALGVTRPADAASRRSSIGLTPMSRQASSQALGARSPSTAALSPGSSHRATIPHPSSPPPSGPSPQFAPAIAASSSIAEATLTPELRAGATSPAEVASRLSAHAAAFQPGEVVFSQQPTPPLSGPWPRQDSLVMRSASRSVSPMVGMQAFSPQLRNSAISPQSGIRSAGAAASEHGTSAGIDLSDAGLPSSSSMESPSVTASTAVSPAASLLHPLTSPADHSTKQDPPRSVPPDLSHLADDSLRHYSQPEIASPRPQGHHENLSEQLTRGLDEKAPEMLPSRPDDTDAAEMPATKPSTFNVDAKEFVFDPTKASFTPSFAFGASNHSSGPRPTSQHSKSPAATSKLNVEAPSFTPSGFAVPADARGKFSFTSAVPFNSAKAPVPASSPNVTSRIFAGFDYTQKFHAESKSKAIPIVKPVSDLSSAESEEDPEDESGRITQADGRQKRARRHGSSGDQTPLFANPTREATNKPPTDLLGASPHAAAIVSQKQTEDTRTPVALDNEHEEPQDASAMPSKAKETVEDTVMPTRFNMVHGRQGSKPAQKATDALQGILEELRATGGVSTDEATGWSFEPDDVYERRRISRVSSPSTGQAASTHAAQTLHEKDQQAVPETSELSPVSPVSSDQPPHEHQELRERDRKLPSSATKSSPRTAAGGGLDASRFARRKSSLSSSASRTPDPTAAPESLQARIHSGVHYVEPTFQEIDDVMQHLNGDDSDLGIERHPAQMWRSPSQRVASPPSRGVASPPATVPKSEHRHRSNSPESDAYLAAARRQVTSSPNRLHQPFQYLPPQESESSGPANAAAKLVAANARFSPSFKGPRSSNLSLESPHLHRAHSHRDRSVSEWNDVVSSEEEPNFRARTNFFDRRLNDVIGSIVEHRLRPLEDTLSTIQGSLMRMHSRSRSRRLRRSASIDVDKSDADDEDDEHGRSQVYSPMRDRKFEKLRTSLLDALVQHRQDDATPQVTAMAQELAELRELLQSRSSEKPTAAVQSSPEELKTLMAAVADIKSSLAASSPPDLTSTTADQIAGFQRSVTDLQASLSKHRRSHSSSAELKGLLEEVVSKQLRGKSAPVTSSQEAAAADRIRLQVTGLESMLKVAESRADDELKARRAIEQQLSDVQVQFKLTQAEALQHKESAAEAEQSLRSVLEGHQSTKEQLASLQERNHSLERNVSELTDKNIAQSDTLAEYRLSHDQWRKDQEATLTRTKDLERTIESHQKELEDSIRTKHALKAKLGQLQTEMTTVVAHVAKDQASWRHQEQEYKARHEHQQARLEAEARTRERFELEINRLETQERESLRYRSLAEQTRSDNAHLTSVIEDLRSNAHSQHEQVLALERELREAKEARQRGSSSRRSSHARAPSGMSEDDNRPNHEATIAGLQAHLERVSSNLEETRQRYEIMLEEASTSRDVALRDAAEAREAALQEHYRFHQRSLDETRLSHEQLVDEMRSLHERMVSGLKLEHERRLEADAQEHARALQLDRNEQRMKDETNRDRLQLAEEKIQHHQNRVRDLEQRLEVAQAAAQAAAAAARSSRATPSSNSAVSHGSVPMVAGSNIPEKISPQALRESIMVLQEQLRDRENRLEKLEQELAQVDHSAPQKIKDRDVEIAWLRELLGVRMDDLQDLVKLLSEANYDRENVRNAMIRLRANLEMQQQERERAHAGGSGRIASLANMAATPQALPMAAAAAWGSWRKGQSVLAEMAAPNGSAQQTPARSSFLSGLLTPPNTSLRSSSPRQRAVSARTAPATRRPLEAFATPKRAPASHEERRRPRGLDVGPPDSPTLLRSAEYEQDAAETSHFGLDVGMSSPVPKHALDASLAENHKKETSAPTSDILDATKSPAAKTDAASSASGDNEAQGQQRTASTASGIVEAGIELES